MLQAPLEQFQILKIFEIKVLSFSITNFFLMNILILVFITIIIHCNTYYDDNSSFSNKILEKNSFFFSSNSWQKVIESVPSTTAQLISDIILLDSNRYFPIISIIFNFILFSNLIGLVPYSFTLTSHLIVTFLLSLSIFIGLNIITFDRYRLETFNLFLPANTTFFLALLLVPIEFISYIAKPISLGVRLFINLMAGHSLLKVIIGFSWNMLLAESFSSVALLLPMFILVFLFGLELGVALIQTYVFVILTCIYIQDIN